MFPFVEDHKFYCEHWFTTRFFQKVKAFGALLARFGVIAEADDVFHLHHGIGNRSRTSRTDARRVEPMLYMGSVLANEAHAR